MKQDQFDGYERPSTTDGSYMGTQKQIKATEKHLQDKFVKGFADLKERLKTANIKVGVKLRGEAIQLTATLPLKPGDESKDGKESKQYGLFLGIPANLDGLKTAEEECYELGRLIARKQFEWNDKYLGKKARAIAKQEATPQTIGELFPEFERKYWETHKKDMKSEHTFHTYQDYLIRLVKHETLVNQESISESLRKVTNLCAIYSAAKTTRVFLNTLDIKGINLDEFPKTPPPTQERHIPTDTEIISGFNAFDAYQLSRKPSIRKDYLDSWMLWRWCFGMLATYGMRPRELFIKPDIEWWLSPGNLDSTWKVSELTKTGFREALPWCKEWVDLFDLKNPSYLMMLKDLVKDKTTFGKINAVRVCLSSWFRRVELEFDPYDLRHRWAIRAHIMGVPIKAAADNLGHTTEIHTKVYQKWFSLDLRKASLEQANQKLNKTQKLELELQQLRLENEQLKIELTRSKLMAQKLNPER
jgi:hypothetical protein